MGTLGGFVIVLLLPHGEWFWLWSCVLALALTLSGFALTAWAESYFGKKDPQYFVLDETVGFLLTVLPKSPSWSALVLGFFLFRFFDVLKPFPIRKLERLPGAWGIFLDDFLAAGYACALLNLVRFLYPEI